MRICISSGHGLHIRGAAGPEPWGLDEVDEARKVVDRVAGLLSNVGVEAFVGHDNVSENQSANLDRIVAFHNGKTRELDVSVHFNCYDTTAKGTEVLYVSQEALAAKVSAAIANAGGFVDRGAKKRTDLAFLSRTEEPAILIEVAFVDNRQDAEAYRDHFEAICRAISEAISGKMQPAPGTEPPPTTTTGDKPVVTITVDPQKAVTFTVEPPGSVTVNVVHINGTGQ